MAVKTNVGDTAIDVSIFDRGDPRKYERLFMPLSQAMANIDSAFAQQMMEAFGRPRPLQELPVPETPGKTAVLVSDTAPDSEYVALANELGFTCPQILQSRLEAFFAEQFIDVYPLASVAKYMDALATNEGVKRGTRIQWLWKPLRPKDSAKLYSHQVLSYDKPVPHPVLLTVKRVQEAFPNEVGFFVSDYEAVKPDPFLMVTAPGLPQYVIERWDEPGFRA